MGDLCGSLGIRFHSLLHLLSHADEYHSGKCHGAQAEQCGGAKSDPDLFIVVLLWFYNGHVFYSLSSF
jgi:hypothetical protein